MPGAFPYLIPFLRQKNAHQCLHQGEWCQTDKTPFKNVDREGRCASLLGCYDGLSLIQPV